MYPVEPKPPSKQLAHLTAIKDIEDVHKQIISGYCIKSMASDPYGHPAFAVTEGKVGSVILYDTEDEKVLRKIAAGYHEIESVTFDQNYNFVMTSSKPGENKIVKHNLKGEKIHEFPVEEVTKLYSVTCMKSGNIAVSVGCEGHKGAVLVYDSLGENVTCTISENEQGKAYFLKPQYIVATGDHLVVGDVGTRSIKCFSTEPLKELWTYSIDMPRGMCVDGGGNLCICDFRNNRVTLLTAEGKLIGHSLTGLSKPQQIALNHNTMFTLDMGRSTSYRISTHILFKTPKSRRKSKSQPEWQ